MKPAKKPTKTVTSRAAERHERAQLKHLELIDEASTRLDRIRSSLVLLVAAAGSGDPALFDLSESDVQSSICDAARSVLTDVVQLRDVHQGLHEAMESVREAR